MRIFTSNSFNDITNQKAVLFSQLHQLLPSIPIYYSLRHQNSALPFYESLSSKRVLLFFVKHHVVHHYQSPYSRLSRVHSHHPKSGKTYKLRTWESQYSLEIEKRN